MRKAYVTVYFTLVLSLCMGLILVLFKGIRENAARMRVREVMQTSMDSAFGEYNRYVWDNYKLIFVDSGFDSKVSAAILAEDHFTECMNKNFEEVGNSLLGERDLIGLKCRGSEFERIRFATDLDGAAIRNQAVEYMRYKTKIEYIEDVYNNLSQYSDEICDIDSYKDKYEASMDSFGEDECQIVFEKMDISEGQAFISDGNLSALSILKSVIKDTSRISVLEINEDLLYTERDHNEGNYGVADNLSLIDKALYREYLMSVCSNYIKGMENSCLSYETEYLLCGKTEDDKNLESVVSKILLLREAANLISFNKDSYKKGEVKVLAATIATAAFSPELIKPLEGFITVIWVNAESMNDMKALLSGKKRPVVKTRDEWKTGLKSLFSDGESDGDGTGLGYCDYLRMLLLTESDATLTNRLINLIELNVRENTDYKDFRMDMCFDACEVTSYVECANGGNYYITRAKDAENY